jgi:hypothetical protein
MIAMSMSECDVEGDGTGSARQPQAAGTSAGREAELEAALPAMAAQDVFDTPQFF